MRYLWLFILALSLCSCANQKEFNAVLRKGTIEERYDFANKVYDQGEYKKSLTIYEELLSTYRGKDQLEEMLYRLAYANYYLRDYYMAAHYFKSLNRQFPNNAQVEEAAYMAAYCKTLESPYYTLDQTSTLEAIRDLQLFIAYYSNSSRVGECTRLIAEMREKLARKAFNIARMYYRRDLYNAAAIAYRNFIKDYPESPFREEAMFLLTKSCYNYAKHSISTKQGSRYDKVLEAYNLFNRVYANSKYSKELEEIYQESVLKINN